MDYMDSNWLDKIEQTFYPAFVDDLESLDDWGCHCLPPFGENIWGCVKHVDTGVTFLCRPVSWPRRSASVSARRWKCWSACSTPTLSASTTPGSRQWRATNASFWWRNSWRRARSKREHLIFLKHLVVYSDWRTILFMPKFNPVF